MSRPLRIRALLAIFCARKESFRRTCVHEGSDSTDMSLGDFEGSWKRLGTRMATGVDFLPFRACTFFSSSFFGKRPVIDRRALILGLFVVVFFARSMDGAACRSCSGPPWIVAIRDPKIRFGGFRLRALPRAVHKQHSPFPLVRLSHVTSLFEQDNMIL